MSKKVRYARLSIASNTLLIIMKVIIGAITGSVSIVSEAIHSGVDLIAALIAYISVKISDTPPDEKHPFGHEKVENISGVIEAVLIFLASGFIIAEAVKKLVHQEPVTSLSLAFIVMFISSGVNIVVSRMLYKVAKSEESVALEADALHLKVDVYTSLGVGAGLFLMWLSGFILGKPLSIIDPIVAILIALFILKEAWEMLKTAFSPLIDESLSKDEIAIIKITVAKYSNAFIDVHEIRTRRSGKMKHIDFHLTVPYDMTVKYAHDLCDNIEHDIEHSIRNTKVLIHTESGEVRQAQLKKNKSAAKKVTKPKAESGRKHGNRKKTGI
jgi:cation diffusion facilitator family transporter